MEQWGPIEVRALRRLAGENCTAFGAKIGKSRRTIENWEQGRNRPDAPACRALAARARAIVAARARVQAARARSEAARASADGRPAPDQL